MCQLKNDNPSFVLHGIEDVKIEDVSVLWVGSLELARW